MFHGRNICSRKDFPMIRVLHETDYQISNWSGGKTIQLAIYPENSDYSKRNFLWRISSATVDLPESDFTALPDYLRQITPISGEMTLQHDGETRIPIPVGTIHTFDGGAMTHSWGCCTDFNLMLRKGPRRRHHAARLLSCGGSISRHLPQRLPLPSLLHTGKPPCQRLHHHRYPGGYSDYR